MTQVNIAAATGDMGILANHVPSIEPLRPGVVEVIESGSATKKWFGEKHAFLRPCNFIFNLFDVLESSFGRLRYCSP